jgi:hypothetical protein
VDRTAVVLDLVHEIEQLHRLFARARCWVGLGLFVCLFVCSFVRSSYYISFGLLPRTQWMADGGDCLFLLAVGGDYCFVDACPDVLFSRVH